MCCSRAPSRLPAVLAAVVFIVVFCSLFVTMASIGIVAAASSALGSASEASSAPLAITLVDPISYAKGLLRADANGLFARASTVLKGVRRLSLAFDYTDPESGIDINIPKSTNDAFEDDMALIIDIVDGLTKATEQSDPLEQVADALPGQASTRSSLLLPNIFAIIDPLLTADLAGRARNISTLCASVRSGAWDEAVVAAVESFAVSKATADEYAAQVRVHAAVCAEYGDELAKSLPGPATDTSYEATESRSSSMQGVATALASGSRTLTSAAAAAGVLSLLVAGCLALLTYFEADARLPKPSANFVANPLNETTSLVPPPTAGIALTGMAPSATEEKADPM